MKRQICFAASTLHYPEGGGHVWVYLNWALGMRALGYRVFWLEAPNPGVPAERVLQRLAALRQRLQPYGFDRDIVVATRDGRSFDPRLDEQGPGIDAAAEADLLLSINYLLEQGMVDRFKRTALLDIDPGQFQVWNAAGIMPIAKYDSYFTIGETVGKPGARFPDLGLRWHHTPPCVSLENWPITASPAEAPLTTVSQWNNADWLEDSSGGYDNSKRAGYEPFLGLPRHTDLRLELALCLGHDAQQQIAELHALGWGVRRAEEISSTPWDYQAYIQQSRGEFGCCKPSCIRLQNAWISDRTLCYLASGKPAVVQHTGPSQFLPDRLGLLRFATFDDAVACLRLLADDYPAQCRAARALAEEYFDARKVVAGVFERAMS